MMMSQHILACLSCNQIEGYAMNNEVLLCGDIKDFHPPVHGGRWGSPWYITHTISKYSALLRPPYRDTTMIASPIRV